MKVSWRFRRWLIRSYRPAADNALYEFQTSAIVILAMFVWMTWAILTYGTACAFVLTLPTSAPVIAWMERRTDWLTRKYDRGLID